jgi:quinol monooxygenase YgiN
MLVVAGTITYDPTNQQNVVAAAVRVAESTRLEEGCLSYEFFADLTMLGRIHVFEEWEQEHHLIAHLETSHLAEFSAVLQSAGMRDRNINRYYVSGAVQNRPTEQ